MVRCRTIVSVIMLVCCLFLWGTASAQELEISGTIEGGLRILSLDPAGNNYFIVYRGDYVQPQMAGDASFEIDIPGLRQVKTFPVKDGGKAYVKMSKAGTFSFTAGVVKGTFEVVEYSAPSYKAVSSAEAAEILKNTTPFILDVRTPGEYRQAHIKGAHLVPVQILQRELPELEPYKERDLFIYCATGNRSTVAARILIQNGFKKIYNLRYGISDWARKGYPVER